MKKTDILLLCIVLVAAALIFAVCFALAGSGGSYALVSVDGEEYARLPLNTDTELLVSTEYGENLIVVENGEVYVAKANCPDGICMNTGKATPMRSVVCLPHRLSVSIEE